VQKRLKFRFGLKTVLTVMFLVAVLAAVYGNRQRVARRQEEALRQIAARGGLVHVYSYGIQVYFEELPPLYCTNGLQRVLWPLSTATDFQDADCSYFDEVADLRRVHFPGSSVSKDGVIEFLRRNPESRVSNRPFAEWN
jgi:hypothetical protein